MKSIAIAGLFVLIGTAAQAEIMCTQHRGCRELASLESVRRSVGHPPIRRSADPTANWKASGL